MARRPIVRQLLGRSWMKRAVVGVVVGLLAMVVGAAPAAAESPVINGTGTFRQLSFVVTSARTAGNATLLEFVENDSLSGTISGTSVVRGHCVMTGSGKGVCQASEI